MTIDFQSRSSRVGRAYVDQVCAWLEEQAFVILGRNYRHPSGVEFDIHARDFHGHLVGIECKASDIQAPLGSSGMNRSDNRWKVFGYLYLLYLWEAQGNERPQYRLVTSHLPPPGSEQRRHLDLAQMLGHVVIHELPYREI